MRKKLKSKGGKLNFTPAGAKVILSSAPAKKSKQYNPLAPRKPRLIFA